MIRGVGENDEKNPFSDLSKTDLLKYKISLLEILRKIEIEIADEEFNAHLRNVYDLLSQLPQEKKDAVL